MGQKSDFTAESVKELATCKTKNEPFVSTIFWPNVIGFAILHLGALLGWYAFLFGSAKFASFFYGLMYGYMCGLGITVGAHRLWSHRTFKAKLPLRIFLLVAHTMSGQNCLWVWVRDHRLHHKYTDTDADPHNSQRGFFFSHVGWLMMKKHPEVIAKGRLIDLSDLEADPWVMFQKRYYKTLYFIFNVLIAVAVPCYFWNETLWNSFMIFLARYVTQLNITWTVNSFAHFYGTRPFDKNIRPVENKYVSMFTWGEGWHNYHHVFPWDYNAAELGADYNFSSNFIHLMERVGQAYDLKRATKEMVMNRVQKYGDGTHPVY